MNERNNDALSSSKQEFAITRVFDAPRAPVFKGCTDPKQMAQWWGAQGFSDPGSSLWSIAQDNRLAI